MQRFKLFVTSAERTSYAQELLDQMSQLEKTYKETRHLIERVKCNAQPNKYHRTEIKGEDNLRPNDDENERLQYVNGLREMAKSGFGESPGLANYLKELADVHVTLEKFHEKYLRQVETFCLKELKKFTDETYVAIKKFYADMEYCRDAYDLARHKLKTCKPEEIDQRGQTATTAQKEFEKQAIALYELLSKMPENQLSLTKAFYLYMRAEIDYAKHVVEAFSKIQSPTRKSEIVGSMKSSSTAKHV